MKANLLGIPLDLGAQNLGVDVGPNALRYQKITEKLKNAGLDIVDLGDVECADRSSLSVGDPSLKYLDEILRVAGKTAQIAENSIKNKKAIIGLGGDHSVTLGLFSGVSSALQGDIGMIYIDAHGDMNTDQTTPTGNIHGMPLSALMGFGSKKLVNIYKKGAKLDKQTLIHIGGCDFDEAEIELAKKEKLKLFRIDDLLSDGMRPLFAMIANLNKHVKNIYVSLDLDSIDSVYAPGTGMPNLRGLTYREIASIASYIGQNCNVVGLDVVEYNPLKDHQSKTAELSIELVARFFGKNYSWYTNYLDSNKI